MEVVMRCTMRIGLHTPGIIYSCGPEMMTHLWPKSQFKDADLNITITRATFLVV